MTTGYNIREGSAILAERFALLGELEEPTPDRQPGGSARTPQEAPLQLAEQGIPTEAVAEALSRDSRPPRSLLGLGNVA